MPGRPVPGGPGCKSLKPLFYKVSRLTWIPKFFTGTRNRTETLRIAGRLEDEHRQIRLGYRPKPQAEDQHRERPFAALLHEHLEWGARAGRQEGVAVVIVAPAQQAAVSCMVGKPTQPTLYRGFV